MCVQVCIVMYSSNISSLILLQYQVKRSKHDDTESVAAYSLSPVGKKRYNSKLVRGWSLLIFYGIYWVGKNRSLATKFFVNICMGYEIYLAQKIWVKNFFSFC